MSVGSVSFWQQNQNYWARAQERSQSLAQTDALITFMGNAVTAQSQGLAAIANQTALSRVNTQLSAAVQSALQGNTGSTTGSSSNNSNSGAASSASAPPPPPAPASGTGTAPLMTGTSLFTLGILKGGSVSVSDGTNTTTYTSTGTDTVGDLVNAVNANVFGNANVAAGLNANGQLVFTAKNNTTTIFVGGSYAPNIGFKAGNQTFAPAAPPAPPPSASTSTGSNSGTASSTSTSASKSTGSTSSSSGIANSSALALQTGGTAAILLASNGGAGSIVNLLT